MKRYISGKPVSNIKDVLHDGQDYILILDEGCLEHLDEIKSRHPVAALSDYALVFSHVPSYFQMLSIPVFFIPENKNRAYVTYYEQTHTVAESIRAKAISTLEEIRSISTITIDTFLNVVYPGVVEAIDNQIYSEDAGYKVRTSIKTNDDFNFASVNADGIGMIFTEFVFFDYTTYPTYKEQRETLDRILTNNRNGNYTIRLFDINHDKIPKWLHGVKLGNYNHPLFERFFIDYLNEQLRCICDLAKKYPISILIPYVKSAADVDYIRNCIDECGSPYREKVKLGAMVENVSIVDEMSYMQNTIDFFSVGTNDLIHSFFDIERTHILKPEQMIRISNDKNFWELLRNIQQVAAATPIRVGGQLPIYPEALERLVEIGYKQFTIGPQWVKQIKHQLANLSFTKE